MKIIVNNIKSLLRRDIKMSIKSIIIKLGAFYIIYIIYNLLIIKSISGYEIINAKNMILEVFKGCSYVLTLNGKIDENFRFPTNWLLINGYIMYVVGDYFYRDIKDNGRYLLIRGKKMSHIYLSKIIWCSLNVVLYYSALIFISGLLGHIFSLESHVFVDENYFKIESFNLVVNVFILYSLTSITLNIILFTLTFKLKPIYSFLISIVLCISSVFVDNKFFIGQHSLLLRHSPFDVIHNLTIYDSILFNFIVSSCLLIVGIALSRKKEVF